jgi:hypothetical protein
MKKLSIIITMVAAIGLSGCKKNFLNESVNPNSPSSSTLQLSLTSAEKGAADIINGWDSYSGVLNFQLYAPYAVWGGYWVENVNGYVSNALLTQYQIQTTTINFPWADLYDNLSDLNIMQVNSTGTTPNVNYEAIAKILTAYDFEQLVDNYNNVPYSQAFAGAKKLTPTYDTGVSIYADLIKQLDAAISLINTNATAASPEATPGSDDIIFGGNMANWKKFANTLKLRLIMRQSNLPIFSTLKAELASTASEGYLDGATQALAQPGYQLSDAFGGQENPFYLNYGIRPDGSTTLYGNSFYLANSFCVNLMNSLNDTSRLKRVYATVDGSDNANMIIGVPNGSGTVSTAVSKIGPGLLNATAPAVLFSGAESLFLQTEAANDGMIPGNAVAFYNAGITASFEALGLTDVQAAAYYAQPGVALGSSSNVEQSIITQKYISLNGYGVFEAYNEYRRTGYPAIPKSINPGALGGPGQLPTRIFYPQIEYSTNPVNVGMQPPATIATEFNSKIFWAK